MVYTLLIYYVKPVLDLLKMDFRQKNKDKRILNALYAKSGQYQNLKQKVSPLLPDNLSSLLLEVSYASGILTLHFSKQIALNQCRFILPRLTQQLKTEKLFQSLKNIQPIVANYPYNKQVRGGGKPLINDLKTTEIKKNKANLLYSDRSAKMLSDLAESTEEGSLKDSLLRLAEDMAEKKSEK